MAAVVGSSFIGAGDRGEKNLGPLYQIFVSRAPSLGSERTPTPRRGIPQQTGSSVAAGSSSSSLIVERVGMPRLAKCSTTELPQFLLFNLAALVLGCGIQLGSAILNVPHGLARGLRVRRATVTLLLRFLQSSRGPAAHSRASRRAHLTGIAFAEIP